MEFTKEKKKCYVCFYRFYCLLKIQKCGHELCFDCIVKIDSCPFCRQKDMTANLCYNDVCDFLDVYNEISKHNQEKRLLLRRLCNCDLFDKKINGSLEMVYSDVYEEITNHYKVNIPLLRMYYHLVNCDNQEKNLFDELEIYLANNFYPKNLEKVNILLSKFHETGMIKLAFAYHNSSDETKFVCDLNKINENGIKLLDINEQALKLGIINKAKTKMNSSIYIYKKIFSGINYFLTTVTLENDMILNFVQYNIYLNDDIVLSETSSYDMILEIIKCYLSLKNCLENNILNAHEFYKNNVFNENEIVNVLEREDIWNKINIYVITEQLYVYVKINKIVSMVKLKAKYIEITSFPDPIRELIFSKILVELEKRNFIFGNDEVIFVF